IPQMSKFYPQLKAPLDQADRVCKGLDCSGLLYEAADGYPPRNTSQLCTFGEKIDVDKFDVGAVQKVAERLDRMVWKGHVILIFNLEEKGVFICLNIRKQERKKR